jgi:predicted nucleic acid-binding Zn ribbon protein
MPNFIIKNITNNSLLFMIKSPTEKELIYYPLQKINTQKAIKITIQQEVTMLVIENENSDILWEGLIPCENIIISEKNENIEVICGDQAMVNISTKIEKSFNYLYILIGVVILIIIYLTYKKYKKL